MAEQSRTPPGPPGAPDPSMEDILASIRRILDDETPAGAPAAPTDDVLDLTETMLAPDEDAARPASAPSPPPAATPPAAPVQAVPPSRPPEPPAPAGASAEAALVGAAAAGAAGASLAALRAATGAAAAVPVRPETLVGYANLTLEQMVREEIRPLLKAWLDENLPPLVERLVKAELERIARG
jgi:cell pole-organizing protein PopZ